MIDVSICMVTYNKLPFLKKALQAILNSLDTEVQFELLVYNNGSDDGTAEHLSLLAHALPENILYKVWDGEENIGLNAYGLLVPHATGKIVVTTDDDIFHIGPPGWEARFSKVLTSRFGGRVFGYVSTDTTNEDGGRMKDSALGTAEIDGLTIEVGAAGGWFAATTQEVLAEVGGFHTGKGAMFLEDSDFQKRAWDRGYLCGTLLDTQVFHARAPKYYRELGCIDTYIEKDRLAKLEGFSLEPLT